MRVASQRVTGGVTSVPLQCISQPWGSHKLIHFLSLQALKSIKMMENGMYLVSKNIQNRKDYFSCRNQSVKRGTNMERERRIKSNR